jgi:hypothetical protein
MKQYTSIVVDLIAKLYVPCIGSPAALATNPWYDMSCGIWAVTEEKKKTANRKEIANAYLLRFISFLLDIDDKPAARVGGIRSHYANIKHLQENGTLRKPIIRSTGSRYRRPW